MPHAKPVRMTQTNAPKLRMRRTRSREPQNGDGFILLLGHPPSHSHAAGKSESDRQRAYGASLCTPGVMADDMSRTKLTQ
jgi:hypothetical protein